MLLEKEIKQLLISKGVSSSYLQTLKKRHVMIMNTRLYEFNGDESEYVSIPVNKIVSTHRVYGSCRSWWRNIFDKDLHNVKDSKWENIQNIFLKESLQEFQHSLYEVALPIESATYYPDYDIYTVNEGHHRTVWAILTNTPYLKVRRLSTALFSSESLQKRKKYFKNVAELKGKERALTMQLEQLINEYGFSIEPNWISYEGKELYPYEKIRDIDLSPISSMQSIVINEYSDVIGTLEYAYKNMTEVLSFHHKYKYIPKQFRTKALRIHDMFSSKDSLTILHQLYDKNWPTKKSI